VNEIAESYVKLVLALGLHDADYVDAFYGPESWQREVEAARPTLRDIGRSARALVQRLEDLPSDRRDAARRRYLAKQLAAIRARIDMLDGAPLGFDDESRALYDAAAPRHDESYFQQSLDALDGTLPGAGELQPRYERFRGEFVIPRGRLDDVFGEAIRSARSRSLARIALPDEESFHVEYVHDKPWSGYNWYRGGYHSVIQVNTDLPTYIDRAIDLAAHEGYPGHHVYNALLEQHLVRERGWMEFSVYALFSPQSLIAEGTANYGIAMAFPGEQRFEYERDTLYKLAGLDASRAEEYQRVQDLVRQLGYAGNEAARDYLDGRLTREQAVEWLMTYALMTRRQAEQRTRFFDKYRSYVINYNLGQDLVAGYVERGNASVDERWARFIDLLSTPRVPSDLT